MSSLIAHQSEPKFTQPFRQIVLMIVILIAVGVLVGMLYPTVRPIFESAPYLNLGILCVFVIGVLTCLYQPFALMSSVSWIEGFALDRPGHEFVRAPRLLASLSALLRDTRARRALTTTSTRSILDSVAQRLEEQRDVTRYITNLLIFLGLLGTFFGLAKTVPEVVNTIRSMAPKGDEQTIDFAGLMDGLEAQLGGMVTAFSSSLLGLAGSLVVGLLELFAGHGQNRFYSELEEWLSSITRISLGSAEDAPQATAMAVHGEFTNPVAGAQIEHIAQLMAHGQEQRAETDAKLNGLTDAISQLTRQLSSTTGQGGSEQTSRGLDRLAESQDQIARLLTSREEETGQLDAETRMRMRNIDVQLLRILEELSAGRQDSVAAIRGEIAGLADAIRGRLGG